MKKPEMIRDAKIEDAKDIVRVNVMGWKSTYKGTFPDSFLGKLDPSDEESIQKCINKIDEYAVCEIDNKIVGIVRYGKNKKNYSDEYGEIYVIYVDKDYQRKQIGTKLMNYVFNKMKDKYKYVLISTLKENNANTFYQKIGGEFVGNCDFVLEDKIYMENIYKYNIKK